MRSTHAPSYLQDGSLPPLSIDGRKTIETNFRNDTRPHRWRPLGGDVVAGDRISVRGVLEDTV